MLLLGGLQTLTDWYSILQVKNQSLFLLIFAYDSFVYECELNFKTLNLPDKNVEYSIILFTFASWLVSQQPHKASAGKD